MIGARHAGLGRSDDDMQELRDYGIGAQVLADLSIHEMVLLTNTSHTPVALSGYGLSIVGERRVEAYPKELRWHGS